MGFVRRHLSYANIAATLALVFAMSGGALAATHYLINSTKQINPKVLKALKGNDGGSGANGGTGAAGAPGSSGAQGVQGAQGSQGPAGPTGNTGPEGPRGPEGPSGPEAKAGDWTALTLSSKVKQVSGFEEAAVRTENGGSTVRIRGVVEVTSKVEAGQTVVTVPAGFRPKNNVEFGIGVFNHAEGLNHTGSLLLEPSGVVKDPETPVPPGVYYLFDGITWNLN